MQRRARQELDVVRGEYGVFEKLRRTMHVSLIALGIALLKKRRESTPPRDPQSAIPVPRVLIPSTGILRADPVPGSRYQLDSTLLPAGKEDPNAVQAAAARGHTAEADPAARRSI